MKKRKSIEERDYRSEIMLRLAKENTKEAVAIRNRLMKDDIKNFLEMETDESGLSVMQQITLKWYTGLMENGVTTKDMVQIMKLRGEDIQKSQSVNLKLTAEAKAVKNTEEFLKEIDKES